MSRAAATSPRVERIPPGWRRGAPAPRGCNRSGGTASGRTRARGKQCSPGRAGHAIVQRRTSGNAVGSTQWRCRATLAAGRSWTILHVGGRPPAPEQRGRSPSTFPPRDHGARATLGRRVRPGVPEGRCPLRCHVEISPVKVHATRMPMSLGVILHPEASF